MADKQIIIDYKEYLELVKENETMKGIIKDWEELDTTMVFVTNNGIGKWIIKGKELQEVIVATDKKYNWERVK